MYGLRLERCWVFRNISLGSKETHIVCDLLERDSGPFSIVQLLLSANSFDTLSDVGSERSENILTV